MKSVPAILGKESQRRPGTVYEKSEGGLKPGLSDGSLIHHIQVQSSKWHIVMFPLSSYLYF